MPPKMQISKERIVTAATELVRQSGEHVLNARSLAGALGCSTQPIFSQFGSMEGLREAVMDQAYSLYTKYLDREMKRTEIPPYKASGMGYIRFAMEERELFRMLFMRKRTAQEARIIPQDLEDILTVIQNGTGMDREQALQFHLEMWVFVHGVACMLVTEHFPLSWEQISQMLTDVYEGVKTRYAGN